MLHPISYYQTRQRTTPDWIIPGWLKRRNTGFIIGPPKLACKSWLALNLGWDLSEGKHIWDIVHPINGPVFQPLRPMRVVYFTQEDTDDDVQDRVLLQAGRASNDKLWIATKDLRTSLDSDEGMDSLDDALGEVIETAGPIDLVMFDPMRRLHQGDENSSEVMVKLWRLIDAVHRKYDCATLFAHHITKPPTVKGNTFDPTSPYAARGSGDLYGGGDAFIMVNPQKPGASGPCLDLHFQTKRARSAASVQLGVNFTTGKVEFIGFI